MSPVSAEYEKSKHKLSSGSGVPEYPALNPTLTWRPPFGLFIQGPPLPGTSRLNDLIDSATEHLAANDALRWRHATGLNQSE